MAVTSQQVPPRATKGHVGIAERGLIDRLRSVAGGEAIDAAGSEIGDELPAATTKAPSTRTPDASIDATGKMHGQLPNPGDLSQ